MLPVIIVLIGAVLLGICAITGGTVLLSKTGLLGSGGSRLEKSATIQPITPPTGGQSGRETPFAGQPTMPGGAVTENTKVPPTEPAGPSQGFAKTIPPELLADFPKDVPLIEDAQDFTRMTAEGSTTYMFSTGLTAQEAMKFYQEGMVENGWKEYYKTESGDMRSFTYSKDSGRTVMVVISSPGDRGAWITITIIQE